MKVKNVKSIKKRTQYDIQTETENFIINVGGKHILAHNSMISPFVVNGKVMWGTRRGVTEQSLLMESEIDVSQYEQDILFFDHIGVSLMFEYVSPKNNIVLKYDRPQLILTGARYMESGNYIDIRSNVFFNKFDIVKLYPVTNAQHSLEEFLEKIRVASTIEGVVISFGDGDRVKCKCEEYVFLHKSKEKASVQREVWRYILEGNLDDLLPFLDEKDSEKVRKMEEELWWYVGLYTSYVEQICEHKKQKYPTKKEFATSGETENKVEKPFIFGYYDGKNVYKMVVEKFLDSCVQEKKNNEWLEYVKGIFA